MDLQDLLKPSDGKREKSESPLKSLKTDLDFYKEAIEEVASEMMSQDYSQYPIFIAHQHEVKVGEIILDREELGTSWTVQASSLEEFVQVGIIQEEKKARFIEKYKDPAKYMCLFVIVPEGANFVFYPYA